MIRPIRKHRAGTAIYFKIETRDETQLTRPRYSPSLNPQIRLRQPDGTVFLNFTNMTQLATGVFEYTHQTFYTDPVGVWKVDYKITGATTVQYTVLTDAYELITGDEVHSDIAHGDSAHSDSAHSDSHSDVGHTDTAHTDTHSDVAHSDVAHVDTHSDVAHSDGGGKSHSDTPHVDEHSDIAHTDVSHTDTHSDVAHGDTAHTDSHSDVAHSDASHTDTG